MRPHFAALLLALAACATGVPTPIVPSGLAPVNASDARLWAIGSAPRQWVIQHFSWSKQDRDDPVHGRGFFQFNPVDSLFLYFKGSVFFSGQAAVVGDSTIYAEPEDQVTKLAPSYELLWAMVGIARPPRVGWQTESRRHGDTAMVQYTNGRDTVQYVTLRGGRPRLETYVVDGGRPLGRVLTEFDAIHQLVHSRLTVLTMSAYVDVAFDQPKKEKPIDPESWRAAISH